MVLTKLSSLLHPPDVKRISPIINKIAKRVNNSNFFMALSFFDFIGIDINDFRFIIFLILLIIELNSLFNVSY